MQSNVLFLHTGCKNKGHVFSFCLFFAYFIVIFTEVNIFSWYFESKMLILQDFFFAIFFFTGARGAYAYANASTLQHCSFAYNRCLLHVFFFFSTPFAAKMAPESPQSARLSLLVRRKAAMGEKESSCLKIHKANRRVAAAASRQHKTQLTRAPPL